MKYYPGDLIIVKYIVFDDNCKDHCPKGRPCIVLFSETIKDREVVHYLFVTSQFHHLEHQNEYIKYIDMNVFGKESLVDLSRIGTSDSLDVSKPQRNIGKELFRIIDEFTEFHAYRESKDIKRTIKIMEEIKNNEKQLRKQLLDRKQELKSEAIYNNRPVKVNDEIPSPSQKWEKKKTIAYKLEKQQAIAKTFAISSNY